MHHGGSNSGRKVSRVNIRAVGVWSIKRLSSSRVEGSAQCRSSHTASTGCHSASSRKNATSASWVRCFCSWGLRASGGSARRATVPPAARQKAAPPLLGGVESAEPSAAAVPASPASPLEHRHGSIAGSVAAPQSRHRRRCAYDTENSETPSTYSPHSPPGRAAPPPNGICQYPLPRAAAPPAPTLPGSAPSAAAGVLTPPAALQRVLTQRRPRLPSDSGPALRRGRDTRVPARPPP